MEEKKAKQQKTRQLLALATKQLGWNDSSGSDSDNEDATAKKKKKRGGSAATVVKINDSFTKKQFGVRYVFCCLLPRPNSIFDFAPSHPSIHPSIHPSRPSILSIHLIHPSIPECLCHPTHRSDLCRTDSSSKHNLKPVRSWLVSNLLHLGPPETLGKRPPIQILTLSVVSLRTRVFVFCFVLVLT